MNHFAKITHFSRIIESAFFSELINFHSPEIICDTLRDLVPFVQFKRGEKRPWRSVTKGLQLY